jgi:hypothetical protein
MKWNWGTNDCVHATLQCAILNIEGNEHLISFRAPSHRNIPKVKALHCE